jgi:hypothetical protein
MKRMLFVLIIVLVILSLGLLSSCASSLDSYSDGTGKTMTLVAGRGHVEVWKIIDSTTVCYLSVNTYDSGAPIGIFCK